MPSSLQHLDILLCNHQRRSQLMLSMLSIIQLLLLLLLLIPTPTSSLGYLKLPRSRNLVAYEDTVWWPRTESDPEPETTPQGADRGGSVAQCGIIETLRNYDTPKNILGNDMPINIQAVYNQEDEINIKVSLISSNGGHFQFSLCPIEWGEIPTQECFDKYPLEFVSDNYYGAYEDPNYPERIYIPDGDVTGRVDDLDGFPGNKQEFSYQMNLPCGLYGDLVLLQWYFVTAQDCYHEGYLDYDFPPEWGDVFEEKINECPVPLPHDGNGLPLQYWNCAEIEILKTGGTDRCVPTAKPSLTPTRGVSVRPTREPTIKPEVTSSPTLRPSQQPSKAPVDTLPIATCDELCLVPIEESDCPTDIDSIPQCIDSSEFTSYPSLTGYTINIKDICIGSGECNTSTELDNCIDGADVYKRIASCAKDDTGVTPEDTPISLQVLDNDIDGVGTGLTIVDFTQPEFGSVELGDNDEIVYTPENGYNGSDEFKYEVVDGNGFISEADVTVEVQPVNDLPVANDDTATTLMNTNVNIPVLENDVDLDDPITINSIVSQPANGTAGIRPEGTIIFKPANDFVGEDTFTYKICDPSIEVQSLPDPDSLCDEATVTVIVERPPNDPPIANDDFVTISEGMNPGPITIPVLANDNDPDGDELNVIDVSEPEHGLVEISPNGDGVVYTPEEGYVGEDTFDYIICDTNNACDNAVVTVTIDPSNTDPIVLDDRVDTPEGKPLVIDVLQNDLPDNLEVTEVTPPSNGTCEITDGQVEYTPAVGFFGQDNCTYTACIEGTLYCDEGSVIVDVIEAPKQPPLAVDDPVTTNKDEPVSLLDPLENDQSPSDSPLNLANVTDGANGTCVANEEDNTVTYTPNTGFVGIDICMYYVCDDNDLCDESAIIISVDETNLPPDANDDQVSTPYNTPTTVPVLDNDVDPDGDELTVTEVTQGLHGKCSITEDNQVMYAPNIDYVGPDICPYVVCDSSNECDTANVFVEVESGPPTANEDQVETEPNTPITVGVINNDIHPEDLPIEVTGIAEQPDNGTCDVVDGQVEYTPNEGFVGSDSCEYTACVEGTDICDSAELTVDVVQPAPAANDDKERVPLNTPVLSDVIKNDINPSTDKPLEVTDITAQPDNGVCEVVDNQVQYTPNSDFIGTDTCEYIVCIKGTEACDTAVLVVDVVEVAIAQDDKVETPQDSSIIVDVIDNDSYSDDPELPLMVVSVSQPTNGACKFTTDGQVEYTPNLGYSGTDECTYTVCLEENTDTCDEGVVIVDVIPKPVSEDDEIETPANTPVLIDVLDNDQPNDAPLEVVTTTQPDNGLCEVVGDRVQYTPDTDFIGTDSCEYIVCVEGSQVLCDEATVTVTVTPTKPIAEDDQVETPSETPVTVNVISNDEHPQDQPMKVTDIATKSENGVCEVLDGQVKYTPNQGFVGSDECDYTVCVDIKARLHRCGIACQVQASIAKFSISIGETEMTTMDGELDSSRLECDEATLTVSVIPNAPIGNDDTSETTPNTPVSIDVLDNDLQPQDLPLEVTDIGNQPEHGVCEVVDNKVLYKPDKDFITGIDSCSYVVCIEDTEVCDSALVTVNVIPQKPIATDDSAQTQPETTVLVDVLDNDEHNNDLPLKVIDIAEQAEIGVCEVVDNQVQYTSDPTYVGTDTCSYIVCVEDTTVCDSAELVVDVIAEPTTSPPTQKPSQQSSQAPSTKPTDGNRDPFANDDYASTLTNTEINIDVLVNDFDSDRNDELSVISTTDPVNGRVEINTDNKITYYPDTGFAGEDSFKYTISDGNGGSDEATVVVSIIMPTQVVSTLTSSPTNQPSNKPVTSSPSKQPSSKPISDSPTTRPTSRPTHSLPASIPSCPDMCFEPLEPDECPSCDPVILPSCSDTTLEVGALCESDGECGLEDQLNNCEGTFDVYRRVLCDTPQEVQEAPDNVCRPRDGETLTISASNDAYVVADNDMGYNNDSIVIAEEPQTDGIIKWKIPDVICECVTIKKVTIRLYVINPSRLGGFVHVMNPNWEESSISWSNTPESSGPPIVQIGEAANESWVEADVTGLVSNSDEHVAVRIQACLKNQVTYASKDYMQGQYAPQLVIELGPSPVGMQMIAGRFQMQQLSHYGRQLGRGTTKLTVHSGDTDSVDEDVSIMQDIPICPFPNHNIDLSTIISSYAADDATIMHQDQDSNSLGDDVLLEVSPSQCGGDMHAMLKFDVSSLGSSSPVEYASILIHVIEGSSLNGAVFLHAPTPDWSEDSINWKTAPEYTEVVGSLSTLQNGMWYEVDVTSAVNNLTSDYLSIRVIPSAARASCDVLRLIFASKDLNGFGPQLVVVPKQEALITLDSSMVMQSSSAAETFIQGGKEVNDCSTLIPSDDTFVSPNLKDMNYGHATELFVDGRPGHIALLQFDVSCLKSSLTSAVLNLYAIDSSQNGGVFRAITGDVSMWDEDMVTYDNAPLSSLLSNSRYVKSLRKVRSHTWVEVDITEALSTSTGKYVTIIIDSASDNRVSYSSKEGEHSPYLVIN